MILLIFYSYGCICYIYSMLFNYLLFSYFCIRLHYLRIIDLSSFDKIFLQAISPQLSGNNHKKKVAANGTTKCPHATPFFLLSSHSAVNSSFLNCHFFCCIIGSWMKCFAVPLPLPATALMSRRPTSAPQRAPDERPPTHTQPH